MHADLICWGRRSFPLPALLRALGAADASRRRAVAGAAAAGGLDMCSDGKSQPRLALHWSPDEQKHR